MAFTKAGEVDAAAFRPIPLAFPRCIPAQSHYNPGFRSIPAGS
jgi:hypothetical protein